MGERAMSGGHQPGLCEGEFVGRVVGCMVGFFVGGAVQARTSEAPLGAKVPVGQFLQHVSNPVYVNDHAQQHDDFGSREQEQHPEQCWEQ